MKAICLLICLVFVLIFVSAQVTTPGFKYQLPPGAAANLSTAIRSPQAKLIGQSALGKIYAMPVDNMPCLVPTVSLENLSTDFVVPLPKADMPNPIPRQNLIPSPFGNHTFFRIKKAPKEASENLMLSLIRKNKSGFQKY